MNIKHGYCATSKMSDNAGDNVSRPRLQLKGRYRGPGGRGPGRGSLGANVLTSKC